MHFMQTADGHDQFRLPLFDINALSYRYPDGNKALDDVSLKIYHGDRIALVGQNGSGKTTLIKHLNGLYRGQSGTVSYKGKEVETDIQRLRMAVGILFQDPDDHLFCNSLYDDVAFGPMNQGLSAEVVDKRVRQCLEKVNLASLAYKPAHLLSYGQKKRAAFATVLAMQPDVLILDEPTANLDPKQERIFKDLLTSFEGTLICINHDLLFLYDLCDRAVVLADGAVHHDFHFHELLSHRASLHEHGLDFSFRFDCCDQNGHGDHHHHHHHHHQQGHHHDHNHDHGYNQLPGGTPLPGSTAGRKPLLELAHYHYRYPDGTKGLEDITLAVGQGESLALVGENGAGKSTLASCLLGIIEGSGDYYFDGRKLTVAGCRDLWRRCGIVFQNSADQLFCPSCREEVAFGPKQIGLPEDEVENRVKEALALVRLDGFEDRVPLNMSGGERKRLAIASVLSMHPEVLVLDEPTAGLDPRSEHLLHEILQGLSITKILVTHDLFFISSLSSRTIVMHQGKIIRDYPTCEFLDDHHLLAVNDLDYTYKKECCDSIMAMQQERRG